MVKLIGNTIISFMLEGLCEGLVVGRKAGLSIETMLEVVMASGYASPYFTFKGGRHRAARLRHALLHRPAGEGPGPDARRGGPRRAPMPGLAAIREVFQAARAQGFGEEDIAAVVKARARPPRGRMRVDGPAR